MKNLLPKFNIHPTGVIQLGAHYFQERDTWLEMGVTDFVLIEPQTAAYRIATEAAKDIPNVVAYNVAVGDTNCKMMMICDKDNQGQSSSLLKPKEHLSKHPHVHFVHKEQVEVCRLDDLKFDRSKYDFIFADLQGYELPAFRGAVETLQSIKAVYTEVSLSELYEGCTKLSELDAFMLQNGFKRVWIDTDRGGYTDCLYVKSN